MKKLGFIAACTLCFVLGTIVPLPLTHAQVTAPARNYYQISFMKSRPGQNPLKMERELWKPIQLDRVKSGQIDFWAVLEPQFSGPHPYDYMTVESSHDADTFTHTNYGELFNKIWGKDKVEANGAETQKARDMIGNEVWVVVESASK